MSEKSPRPLASTRREMRELRQHSQATVAELKAFLAEMRGRSPQEMLGMVASHRLVRSIVQAAVLVGVIVLACTIVPYLQRERGTGAGGEAAADEAAEAAVAGPPESAAVEPAGKPDSEAAGEVAGADELARPRALESLGVGEEKAAPPDINPLDAASDSFLDELE